MKVRLSVVCLDWAVTGVWSVLRRHASAEKFTKLSFSGKQKLMKKKKKKKKKHLAEVQVQISKHPRRIIQITDTMCTVYGVKRRQRAAALHDGCFVLLRERNWDKLLHYPDSGGWQGILLACLCLLSLPLCLCKWRTAWPRARATTGPGQQLISPFLNPAMTLMRAALYLLTACL